MSKHENAGAPKAGGEDYWKQAYSTRPYHNKAFDYDDYGPAYRQGMQAREAHQDRDWDESLESELKQDWERARGPSKLEWEDAKHAVRDAWFSAERELPDPPDGAATQAAEDAAVDDQGSGDH